MHWVLLVTFYSGSFYIAKFNSYELCAMESLNVISKDKEVKAAQCIRSDYFSEGHDSAAQ